MSVSHIIILGFFTFLGSAGLAMIQSALSVAWKAAGFSLPRRSESCGQVNSPLVTTAVANRPLARVAVKMNRPLP